MSQKVESKYGEQTALVELLVCRLDVALTEREAVLWSKHNGFMPAKVSVVTEYLYCYPVMLKDLKPCPHENPEGSLTVGSWVANCEPQCPMDGCTSRYRFAEGQILATFPTYDGAVDAMYGSAVLADPSIPKTEFWYTNIYQ